MLSNAGSTPPLPDALPGFSHINRYWDKYLHLPAAKILPGEFYVTTHKEVVATVLGSCIAVCVRDKTKGIGGMNHFMLPKPKHSDDQWNDAYGLQARYGTWAMEYLINTILKLGGMRKQLEVKVFGGANVLNSYSSVGVNNIDFILRYLKHEEIAIAAQDLGGIFPRKVLYFPDTGAAKVRKLKQMPNDTLYDRERTYQKRVDGQADSGGSVELFDD
ncbi:MAG: chemoreceptor glutamine deamidase CheD [Oleiphilaceae bacterium]|nr:chemoreceptor glutamine deamidase CheD [Oleiphilaceae bacterium]